MATMSDTTRNDDGSRASSQQRLPPTIQAYQMCSRHECEQREQGGDVSVWERPLEMNCHGGPNDVESKSAAPNTLSETKRLDDHPNNSGRGRGRSGRGRGPRGGRGRGRHYHQQSQQPPPPNHRHGPPQTPNNPHQAPWRQRPPRQVLDPCRAVQKYRRSAAGSDVEVPYRSPTDLQITAEYLLHLLVHNDIGGSPSSSLSFRSLVEFWENRVRALQVDWVKFQRGPSLDTTVRLIRAQIIILYLLVDVQTYEVTFGQRSLQTLLSQFWKDLPVQWIKGRDHDNTTMSKSTSQMLDEMLDEILLYHTVFLLQQDLANGEVGSAVLEPYRNLLQQQQPNAMQLPPLPRFQWALSLVSLCALGPGYSVLHHLSQFPGDHEALLCVKCLLAPLLSQMRWKTLQASNVSWNKGEQVTSHELARLLHCSDHTHAQALAQHYGLPTEEMVTKDDDANTSTTTTIVRFKVVPIQPYSAALSRGSIRTVDDPFVFSKVGTTKDSWRVDGEGLRLPPVVILEELLLPTSRH